MQYNIHPILVHFPIAFLFIYSLIKIIPLQKWLPRIGWKDIERLLLLVGVLGSFAALSTGEVAEHFAPRNHKLVEMHAVFATAATWIYGSLLAGEVASIFNNAGFFSGKNNFVTKTLKLVEKIFCNRVISIFLAIFGLGAIAITGLLGGVITYGVTADPLARTVLNLLGIAF